VLVFILILRALPYNEVAGVAVVTLQQVGQEVLAVLAVAVLAGMRTQELLVTH
jgi:hypothetical protein